MINTTLLKPISLIILVFSLWNCTSTSEQNNTAQSSKLKQVSKSDLPTFSTQTVHPSTLNRTIPITGRLYPLEQVGIVSEVQGKALPTQKSLKEGVVFQKGEVMVKVDSRQFEFNLTAQKSQFQSALVRIMSDLKLDYPEAHPTWSSYLEGIKIEQAIPALPEVEQNQLRYFLSANNIFNLYYAIKGQEELLKKYQIDAPFKGVITQSNIDPGSVVSPGAQLGSISRIDAYEVKAAVSLKDKSLIKVGQSVVLSSNTTKKEWKGRIHRVNNTIDPSTQSISVFIRLSGNGLSEGMYLEGQIPVETLENVVVIPRQLLNRQNQVHIIQDSVVQLKSVNPIDYKEDMVVVRGLQSGDQLIINLPSTPIVGTRAKARKVTDKSIGSLTADM